MSVSCRNEQFNILFEQQYEQLQRQPNLIFMDQYGVKEVTTKVLKKLCMLDMTDFLFFVSSSSFKRFAGTPEFQEYFPDIDSVRITDAKYEDIHRILLDYYRCHIPPSNNTKLYPFTLKKDANIYGLVFGSQHPLGVEKYLDVAWGKNQINGEANFDIDNDAAKKVPSLFDGQSWHTPQVTKKEYFEEKLEQFIVEHREVTNLEVLYFTLDMGHPKAHAKKYISRLRQEGIIACDGTIGISCDTCIKKKSIKTIRAISHG